MIYLLSKNITKGSGSLITEINMAFLNLRDIINMKNKAKQIAKTNAKHLTFLSSSSLGDFAHLELPLSYGSNLIPAEECISINPPKFRGKL
jgi:hypothetical protein